MTMFIIHIEQVLLSSAGFSAHTLLPKLSKLLVFFMGRGSNNSSSNETVIWEDDVVPTVGLSGASLSDTTHFISGDKPRRKLSPGTHLLITLLRSLRTYVHPSNIGHWSDKIGLLMAWVSCSVARRVGAQQVQAVEHGGTASDSPKVTADDAAALIDCALPLIQEMLFAKHPTVVDLAERSLRILAGVCNSRCVCNCCLSVLRTVLMQFLCSKHCL
jgi:Proteasome-substrate-size regulator, mid region